MHVFFVSSLDFFLLIFLNTSIKAIFLLRSREKEENVFFVPQANYYRGWSGTPVPVFTPASRIHWDKCIQWLIIQLIFIFNFRVFILECIFWSLFSLSIGWRASVIKIMTDDFMFSLSGLLRLMTSSMVILNSMNYWSSNNCPEIIPKFCGSEHISMFMFAHFHEQR